LLAFPQIESSRRLTTRQSKGANMAIACAGYRIMSKVGHHRVSSEGMKLVLGKAADKYADYFETCLRKRNTIDCTYSSVATETEAKEIRLQARQFYAEVEDWITKNHPSLGK
jgi:hypothetical protein